MADGRRPVAVSVVVPARDEAQSIGSLLTSLLGPTSPPAEIVVVDAGSRDETVAVTHRYAAEAAGCGTTIRVLEIGPAFPGKARNAGARAASFEWLAFIDAGCLADDGWLAALIRCASADEGDGVGAVLGNYEPIVRSEWDAAQMLVLVPPVDPRTGCRPPSIASCLLRREAWLEVGGFAEDLRAAEDLLFFQRLEESGLRLRRCPQARIRWTLPSSPAGVFRRLRLYSRHHLAAGLFATWHLRVGAMDVFGLALLLAGLWWPPAAVTAVGLGVARLMAGAFRRRQGLGGSVFRPTRLVRAALLLGLADAAAWAGAWDHCRLQPPKPEPSP